MKISIILPTYNEKENISDLIKILSLLLEREWPDFEIIVIDDNSPDGTGYLVAKEYANSAHVTCVIRDKERGLASALKTGILRSTGEIIILMDADFNHDPFKVTDMISLLDRYDVVSGSRYLPGGGMLSSPFRYWGSYFFNSFIRLTTGLVTTDNLSGFVAFRRNILGNLDLDEIFFGYGDYYIRFLCYLGKLNLNLVEIPVTYKMRCGGSSKTNLFSCLIKYTLAVMAIKIKRQFKS